MGGRVTKQIEFEDIRRGDLIRVQHKAKHGVRATREGVAGELLYGDVWVTVEGGSLAFKDEAESITLLERPEPQEPVGVGVVVETGSGVQLVSIDPFPNGNRWVLLWRSRRASSGRTTAHTWDYLVSRHGEIAVVRKGM